MQTDQVLNPGPLALESDVLLTGLRGPTAYRIARMSGPCQVHLFLYRIFNLPQFINPIF